LSQLIPHCQKLAASPFKIGESEKSLKGFREQASIALSDSSSGLLWGEKGSKKVLYLTTPNDMAR